MQEIIIVTKYREIDKLIEMHLTTMADALRNQFDYYKFKEVPFEDRFGMLVDIEYGLDESLWE